MTRTCLYFDDLADLVQTCGHLSIRTAKMESSKRYKIDVSNPNHPVVLLNVERSSRDLALAAPAVIRRLVSWHLARKRAALSAVVDELERDPREDVGATGTDDAAADRAALRRRGSFEVVHA